jgi:hypothetical protein
MIIVFDKLFTECIHDPILHNRCRENRLRNLLSVLLNSFAEYNDLTFKEINRQRNCHFADYGTKWKIIRFFEKYAKTSEVKLFVSNANLYQIAIPNTEIRLIGDLRRNYFHSREKAYDDLFSVLFIDFDHTLHKNIRSIKAKQQHDLICVMKEKDCA